MIEYSAHGFNVIHGLPTDLEVGNVHEDDGYGLGERAGGLPRFLPRRGAKGRDDRLFLEALHYFSVHNVTWRALPERFGKWNSVWKRFDRLSKAGVFETFFDHLAALSSSAYLVQMFDSTVVRAHVSAAGAKGGRKTRRLADQGAASRPRST
ncbi:transposase [Mesorhizobium sp. M0622]|uniref:transposase n=1 Tax=Mesorhizobium sp. M0622 TaxID=2956975 RepID=UPI00333BCE52